MRIDLEDLAEGYSHRPASAPGLARARRAAVSAGVRPGDVAVDIGGGRGRHAAVWLEHSARPVVADPSRGMVNIAARLPGVTAIRAVAQALPLRDGSARLAYFHLSIHYGDWRRALDEALRIVGRDGECWIWTMGEQHHRESFLARWFPSVGDIDAARFPEPGQIAEYLQQQRCAVELGKETESKVSRAGAWRDAVAARFVSTLQLIPAEELARGLEGFDAEHPDRDEPVEYVLTFDWLRAIR
ncbi:MAG: class I SAM-dependent methyltransferase [Acidimicrobiia bacterium]|nr:class I SAM-dependent methyltransferase [Acidimicrobiia bacterium]